MFNPFFLDRLYSQPNDLVSISRQQLKLFDTTMKLESRGYEGPFLPKDTNYRNIHIDSRVMRTASKLMDPLADVVGDITRLGKSVVLSSLPLHPLYVVDLMVYPTHAASLLQFGFNTNNNSNVAVLVMTPEHYDRSGEHLVGSQAMRFRQLTIIGFKLREYLQKL